MLFQLLEINNCKPTEIKCWETIVKQYGLVQLQGLQYKGGFI